MISQEMIWIKAVEMYFSEADEGMLMRMSEALHEQGSYCVDSCSVTFTTSKPMPAMRDRLPAVIDLWKEIAVAHAEDERCNFEFINLSLQLMEEKDAASFKRRAATVVA